MKPNPLKSRCRVCKARPYHCDGGLDSNFTSCDCRDNEGRHRITIYGGWDLPAIWRLNWWYAARFYTVKFIRWVLAV